jgi:hypothetical protein
MNRDKNVIRAVSQVERENLRVAEVVMIKFVVKNNNESMKARGLPYCRIQHRAAWQKFIDTLYPKKLT